MAALRYCSKKMVFLKKITVNKDHAVAIISPPPPGKEGEYPHILSNVVQNSKFPTDLLDIRGV